MLETSDFSTTGCLGLTPTASEINDAIFSDLMDFIQSENLLPTFSESQLEDGANRTDLQADNSNVFYDLGISDRMLELSNNDRSSDALENDWLLGHRRLETSDIDPLLRRMMTNSASINDAELEKALQKSLEKSLADQTSPGSIAAVLTAEGQLWTGATGLTDIENNIPATAEARFNAGSITKPFTATVIMQLVEENRLSLEDTMTRWLPDSITDKIANSGEITIRQLLSHTSGVSSAYMNEYSQDVVENPALIFQNWTTEDLLSRYVYGREADFTPGMDAVYNSSNYFLLGLIVESVTGSSLTQAFRDRIINPLNLNNTFMPDEAIPGGYQPGYVDVDGDGVFDLNAGEADLIRAGGAGALVSNVQDIARFTQALFGGELVNSSTLHEMITGGVSVSTDDPLVPEAGVGLGFGYRDVIGEGRHFFAAGDSYGWTVRVRHDQESGITTVLFRNGIDITATKDYANRALDDILGVTRDYQSALQYGTGGNNALKGTAKPDTIYGLDGNDRIFGLAGSDILAGNEGNDRIKGGKGLDWINGGNGRDRLFGNAGHDYLIGGAGGDWLAGGKGNDRLQGNSGRDRLRGGSGNDWLDGGVGHDSLKGGKGDDIIIDPDGGRLTGGSGQDDFRIGNGRLPSAPKIDIFPPVPDFTITDFTIGDVLTLNFGIGFDDLTFFDTEQGALASTSTRAGLFLLKNVESQALTKENFRFGNAELKADFQAALDQALAESNVPGISVSVIAPDGTTWTSAKGVSELENNTPLNSDDRFTIASVTKLFTATTILQLAEESALGLDDLISRWVPTIAEQIPNGEQITVRQLLGHTSGIREVNEDILAAVEANPELALREWIPREFIEYAYSRKPMSEPGQFGYSNTNYLILGEIIEAATHSTIAQQFQSRIFDPLGLENTFYALPEDIPGGYVRAYLEDGEDGSLVDILSSIHPSLTLKQADGGIVSTPTDMAQFAQALFSGELVSPTSLEQMVRDQNPFTSLSYGLGVMHGESATVGRLRGHSGALELGWRANLYHLPDLDLTVAIAANSYSESSDPAGELLDSIIIETLEAYPLI